MAGCFVKNSKELESFLFYVSASAVYRIKSWKKHALFSNDIDNEKIAFTVETETVCSAKNSVIRFFRETVGEIAKHTRQSATVC